MARQNSRQSQDRERSKPPNEAMQSTMRSGETPPAPADAERSRQLQRELDTTREELQCTIEELEASNEELKASNEEIRSMNQQLQTTNEQLETSKESLQALNAELNIVNAQLEDKVAELVSANNDMANLFNSTGIATVILDASFRIRRFTPAATRLFKLIPADVCRPITDIARRFADDAMLDDARQVLRELSPIEREVHSEDGRWFARRVSVYQTLDHRVDGIVITFVDITERKQSADAVVHRLASIVEGSADAIFSKDLDGTVRTWNRGAERLYGYTAEEIIGRSVISTIPEDRLAEWSAVMQRLARGEHVEQMETERLNKDGRRVPVAMTYSPLQNGDGKVHGASAIARDISEPKQVEETLRQSEQRFRRLADSAPVMIWMTGTDKSCTWVSKQWLDFVGRTLEQELGYGWAENIHAEDHDLCLHTYSTAFDAREPFSMEYRMKRHDGAYRWLLDNGCPLYASGGEFAGYIGSCVDITERREAEDSVAATYRQLKLAMSAGRMVPWTWDPHKDVVSTTENLREICGLASIDTREQGESLLHPDDRRRHGGIVDQALRQGTPYQSVVRMTRPDNGQEVWLDLRAVPVTDRDGHLAALSGIAIDITERKRAEQELLTSEQRLQAILNTAADAIITIDRSGIIQSVNAAAERMFGYAAAEMVGQNVNMLMVSPYREAHDGYIARYLRTKDKRIIGTSREVNARRKDGSVFPTDLTVSEIEHLGLFTGIHRDLTERKQLERDVVQAASLEQRRIGQDLHDSVGQELTALNILTRDLADTMRSHPDSASQLLERMAHGLQRCQRELRAVMRGLLPVAVDAQGLMAALADLADRTLYEAKVTCTFECPAPVAVADNLVATHLYLIAQEATLNAVKHARPRSIRISLTSDHVLTLRVQDDGIGMPQILFDGQGLGLRIMHNRAAIIGATLTIGPAEPKGTAVTCVLTRSNHDTKEGPEQGPGSDRG
jgi:PAS domain S-box-containing protein